MSRVPGAPEPVGRSPLPPPLPQAHPHRKVLADEVYANLREGLISRRIAPGTRLNLDQLARELHVSNTPVRQALARLESDGLVVKEPYRGFSASRLLDSRSIGELYGYRLLVEPATAALAARRRSEADVSELDSLCDEDTIRQLVTATPQDSQLGQRDIDFHCCAARCAGNSVVVDNLSLVLTKMGLYSGYGQLRAGEAAWAEHRAVAAAITARDPAAAAAAMRTHLINGLDRMRQAFG